MTELETCKGCGIETNDIFHTGLCEECHVEAHAECENCQEEHLHDDLIECEHGVVCSECEMHLDSELEE